MKKILVVGGGLFGCCAAIELSKANFDVTLIEQNKDILSGASKHNHNRIHFGFHYPRSPETARQSLDGLILFLIKFKDSIVSDFPNYYFIEKNSKVTPQEYMKFCDDLEIHYSKEYPENNMIDRERVACSLRVLEPIFDYRVIKKQLKQDLNKSKVNVKLNQNILFEPLEKYDHVVNASYGSINKVNAILQSPPIKLKLQDVIIPIFKSNIDRIGLTIMDGPFCSVMPKGFEKETFLLYHVVHSVASQTLGDKLDSDVDVARQLNKIYKESEKHYPFLKTVDRCGFWRTNRALPINKNDERLSEIFYDSNNTKVLSILSGKVSTCWSTALKVKKILLEAQ